MAYDTLGVRVVNIAAPANPYETGYYQIRTLYPGDGATAANGVSLWDGKVYVCYQSKGLQVFQYYGPTGVAEMTNDELRIKTSLGPNRPNPFTASTTIRYSLSSPGLVTLAVYNVMGQKVRTLVNGQQQDGAHEVNWNGKNDAGKQLSAGVYFCRLESGNYKVITKMVKLK
ncbi:MAG: FlgD immunoglobulin-like domain containing protein [Candidatus Edwardsbacteria bacterium]|nr:FlgD immunoglobulin-like domain containing protein [Candidatus Edwardsbacteria bacterium]